MFSDTFRVKLEMKKCSCNRVTLDLVFLRDYEEDLGVL